MWWATWTLEGGTSEGYSILIKKLKKVVRGKICYYYQKMDLDGYVTYTSDCFATRGGRNKAVNKVIELENAKVEDD
jgi:hypothetical protein